MMKEKEIRKWLKDLRTERKALKEMEIVRWCNLKIEIDNLEKVLELKKREK